MREVLPMTSANHARAATAAQQAGPPARWWHQRVCTEAPGAARLLSMVRRKRRVRLTDFAGILHTVAHGGNSIRTNIRCKSLTGQSDPGAVPLLRKERM